MKPTADTQRDIRGVLIQVTAGRLLLPNASVAEVITYSDPEPVSNAPEWLLGRVRWRGWRLPLLSFSRLAGWSSEDGHLGAKVAVLKALGGNAKLPFFAVLSQGFPRLVTVSRERLQALGDQGAEARVGVRATVEFNDEPAVIPDIDGIEQALREALAA